MSKLIKYSLIGAGALLTAGVALGVYLSNKEKNVYIPKATKKTDEKDFDEMTFEEKSEKVFGTPITNTEEKTKTVENKINENFEHTIKVLNEFTEKIQQPNLSIEEKSEICKEYQKIFEEAFKANNDAYTSFALKQMITLAEAGDAFYEKDKE